jgi:DegV family protein with EDD domain
MRTFAIVTDSGCDMPESYFKEHDVVCVKLGFTMQNVNYEGESGEAIGIKEFYARLRAGAMPTTYQVTAEMAVRAIEPLLKRGQDVLIITFSSALSGTADSFALAAKKLQERYTNRTVIVVDSLCASMGQGLLLDCIVKRADSGESVQEVADFAERIKGKICHHFTVDSLFHLKRGGRVSTGTAIVGSILNIKPILHVDKKGRLVAVGKVLGRKKSLHALVERTVAAMAEGESEPVIFISHADCVEATEYVQDLLLEHFPRAKIRVGYIGAVIGAHAGCGTLAVFHVGKERV